MGSGAGGRRGRRGGGGREETSCSTSDDVLIAAVWVDPAADDAEAVFANNFEATVGALAMGQQGLPSATDIEESRTDVWNPFFRSP